MINVVVLISGSGSNLQAMIDADLAINIQAVISNQANVYGLERAQQANIATHVLDHQTFATRQQFDQALHQLLQHYQPDLVILAGFMRILGSEFVNNYQGKLLNIHPSLLPKYTGLNTHQRALDAKEQYHGATVHFVTAELDSGPLIIQAKVPVYATDTAKSLAQRVLVQEHKIYPQAVDWFASGRLVMRQNLAYLDNTPLRQPVIWHD